ncbi:peptidase s41 family protein [Gigaspora margarita]|uniref:Peptidase s41 family protein n=1 Tax=Gigaspora margarita TaxID=4874 RepID=A0A8H4EKA6_GIGMA|nr:peptidase s41 family protein [Gigaspora margarita]
MKTKYLKTIILIFFINIVYPNWIPRKENNKNATICDKLDEYVNSPYSEEQFLNIRTSGKRRTEEPNPGFALRPIDLISELGLYDVASLIEELRWTHRGLSMYSVIKKDGTQRFDARFNSVLASLAFGNGDFYIKGQLFTYRNQLPKNPSISYTLNCNVAGFKLFAEKGIKKIILYLSNNGGGDIFIGNYINKLLFPNIQNFPLDYKVNDISIPFIKEISRIKKGIGNIFHYKSFLSIKTKASFNIVNDFIGNNIYTRCGVQVRYTTKSSCAIITQRLAEINVPTIAVGGFPNTRFSFAQYAVGDASSSAEIQPLLKLKNINDS